MKKLMQNIHISFLFLIILGCFFAQPFPVAAQTVNHTVQEGDTLWSICEKYYGDPDLWPKLWQMNPFITNPHLLEEGDIITLFKKEEAEEKSKERIVGEKPPAPKKLPEPSAMGISVDGFTNVDTLGFLSLGKVRNLGTLITSETGSLILSTGDSGYVLLEDNSGVKTGDVLVIGEESPPLKHPVTGQYMGHTFSVNGRVVVMEQHRLARKDYKSYNKDNLFRVKIVEVYEPIQINNIVVPYYSVSSCVLPSEFEKDLLANIVASKKQKTLIDPNAIVYIDRGFNDGLNRGNIFEIVKPNIVIDPEPGKRVYPLIKGNIILPDLPIGSLMILESRPETSTAIVLTATEPIEVGAYVKTLQWKKDPDFLTTLIKCPVE